jgi:hypothetical protein
MRRKVETMTTTGKRFAHLEVGDRIYWEDDK